MELANTTYFAMIVASEFKSLVSPHKDIIIGIQS